MSRLSRIILGYLVSFLFIVIPAKAQKEAEVYNVDSSLYAYYQRCQEHLLEPVVLSMSDTLFRMASGQNDQRMQAVALSTRLDYYYYQANNEDSIIFYTNKVKQFAKEIQQSKYYYFAWANRLILYYLKTGRSNIALYEAEKVLKEAQAEDNKTGLMYCYNIMSQIYTIKNFDVMASEWRVKEIELTEKYKLENYNISNTYAQLANYYITHHQPEPALEALEKAVENLAQPEEFRKKYPGAATAPFALAVGDGNHSLATAKAYWEELKPTLSQEEQQTHPARFCLAEVCSISSPALQVEPIHRAVFGIEPGEFFRAFEAFLREQGALAPQSGAQPFCVLGKGGKPVGTLCANSAVHPLAVGTLEAFLGVLCAQRAGVRVDYIHGEVTLRALSAREGAVGVLLPPFEKRDLLRGVAEGGVLPKKTFSMGSAEEKRYYLECRRIAP